MFTRLLLLLSSGVACIGIAYENFATAVCVPWAKRAGDSNELFVHSDPPNIIISEATIQAQAANGLMNKPKTAIDGGNLCALNYEGAPKLAPGQIHLPGQDPRNLIFNETYHYIYCNDVTKQLTWNYTAWDLCMSPSYQNGQGRLPDYITAEECRTNSDNMINRIIDDQFAEESPEEKEMQKPRVRALRLGCKWIADRYTRTGAHTTVSEFPTGADSNLPDEYKFEPPAHEDHAPPPTVLPHLHGG